MPSVYFIDSWHHNRTRVDRGAGKLVCYTEFMREIEIKARVDDQQGLLEALTAKGIELSDPIKQHDVVYGIPGTEDNAPDSVWLRIRTEDDTKTIFTLKKQHEGGLDSIEHETEVSDPRELESIIQVLGFELYSDLTKHRQKAAYKDIEICVDLVDDLGAFIEAEKLTSVEANGAQVVEDLWAILEDLGVHRSNEVFDGYDVLMNKKLAADH